MYRFSLKRAFVYMTTVCIVFACFYWFGRLTGIPDLELLSKIIHDPYNNILNPQPDAPPYNFAQYGTGFLCVGVCGVIIMFFGLCFLVFVVYLKECFNKYVWALLKSWAEAAKGGQRIIRYFIVYSGLTISVILFVVLTGWLTGIPDWHILDICFHRQLGTLKNPDFRATVTIGLYLTVALLFALAGLFVGACIIYVSACIIYVFFENIARLWRAAMKWSEL